MAFFEWRDAPKSDYAVIGDPIEHSRSPAMHQHAFDALGLDLKYVAVRVPVEETSLALDHLRTLGYRGVNVTVPLKEAVIDWLSEVEDFARRVRAVNTIDLVSKRGINTDAPGFTASLSQFEFDQGSKMLLLGAGGSSRAIALEAEQQGFELFIYNRTVDKAHSLVSSLRLKATVLAEPDVRDIDLIVNATSASLYGERLAIDWTAASPNAVAYDLFYSSHGTQFLVDAQNAGLRTVDGLALLAAQGRLSFEWWLGRKAPEPFGFL